MQRKNLPLPPVYRQEDSRDPNFVVSDMVALQNQALAWAKQHGIKNIGAPGQKRIALLVIDDQDCFSFPTGSLFVGGQSGTGAMDDQDRLSRFIFENTDLLWEIICTLDTHSPYQGFFPIAHIRPDGSHPDPMTNVTEEKVLTGLLLPSPAFAYAIGADYKWLVKQNAYYCRELKRLGRYEQTLWPYHGILGSNGHRLSGVIDQARLFHGFARGAPNIPEVKGGNPYTECYSIFGAEIRTFHDGTVIENTEKNVKLIKRLVESDMVIIAGQAKSHCLAWSIQDFLTEILSQDPEIAKKVYLLEDCTSPVVVPGIVDYTKEANDAVNEFRNAGMHVVRSTDPMASWPGIAAQLAA